MRKTLLAVLRCFQAGGVGEAKDEETREMR